MGKGKGKKSRKGDLKKTKEPKVKGLPSTRPPNPTKVANKLIAKEKRAARLAELKAAIAKDPSLLKPFPTPMQRTETFMKNPNAAKWPHLFKRQLGLIEMHIDSLSRIMDAMKNDGDTMSEKEKLDWELGERGNWRAICGMMDKARLVLSQTKEAAQGVLPPERLRDKKKLGVVGTEFEPLVPKLDEKCRQLGYDPKGKGALGRSMDFLDKDGDSQMSDASDSSEDSSSDDEDAAAEGADFIKLEGGKEKGKKNKKPEEPSPAFFVDTEPTPVDLSAINTTANPPNDGLSNRKRKIMEKEAKAEERLAKRMAKKAAYEANKAAAAAAANGGAKVVPEKPTQTVQTVDPPSPKVDFKALEAKLQAEIADSTRAQQEAEREEAESAEKRAKKKRRRSGEGGEEVVEKKAKKEKNEKKEKKEKKRKADEEAEVEENAGKKKKRKYKTEDSD